MVSFQEFSDFVRDETRYRKPISPDTDIVYDLGVAGIDGEEFARALLDKFGFRLTDDEILQHFGEERAITPWHLLMWLLGKAERQLKPLTVKELYDRICAKEQGQDA